MKKLFSWLILCALAMPPGSGLALDPYAPRSDRDKGMIRVLTPQPSSDAVTITKAGGYSQTLPPNTIQWVPIGRYHVQVKMQRNQYEYKTVVSVTPTEFTEVPVVGFGNLEVKGPAGATVEAIQRGTGRVVASFPVNEVRTIPQGYYDVRIQVGNSSVTEHNVLVFTNTTRKLVVSLQPEGGSREKARH